MAARYCSGPCNPWKPLPVEVMSGLRYVKFHTSGVETTSNCGTGGPQLRVRHGLPSRRRGGFVTPDTAAAVAATVGGTFETAPPPSATAAAAGCCVGAASGGSSVLGLSASALFSGSSALMVPVYIMLAFFPRLKPTRSLLLHSPALLVGLSLLYAAALAAAWGAGLGAALGEVCASLWGALTGPPAAAAAAAAAGGGGGLGSVDLSPLARMFRSPLVAVTSWLHLITLDALMAREIALDGIRTSTPTWHSVLLCFFFGPTGLLSHAVTRMLRRAGGR